jgi:hypothetical protein
MSKLSSYITERQSLERDIEYIDRAIEGRLAEDANADVSYLRKEREAKNGRLFTVNTEIGKIVDSDAAKHTGR